jgi:protein-disulfide isomerase
MGNTENRVLIIVVFLLTIACSVALTLLLVKPAATEEQQVTAIGAGVSAEEVEKTVALFLKENPHVIVAAFQASKQKDATKEREASEKAIKSRANEIVNDPSSPFTGNPKGDVTIVKFSDYNCGFCKRVVPDLQKILDTDKNVKFVMKDFPILGPRSSINSSAAVSVFRLNPEKWWEFNKAMLKNTPRNDEQLYALVAKHGVDVDALKLEMKKPEVAAHLDKNRSLGSAIGVRGTPAFVINGEFIRGAVGLDTFRERIAAARAGKK